LEAERTGNRDRRDSALEDERTKARVRAGPEWAQAQSKELDKLKVKEFKSTEQAKRALEDIARKRAELAKRPVGRSADRAPKMQLERQIGALDTEARFYLYKNDPEQRGPIMNWVMESLPAKDRNNIERAFGPDAFAENSNKLDDGTMKALINKAQANKGGKFR